MKAQNPMHNDDTRALVSKKLKAKGHKPPVRGGNGRPASQPHRQLAEALGWQMEYVVPTKMPRGTGYPTCYKIDIAHPGAKIAVEVDGASHAALTRQQQDRKKEAFLQSIGWRVLRFTNKEVMADLNRCVQTVLSTT